MKKTKVHQYKPLPIQFDNRGPVFNINNECVAVVLSKTEYKECNVILPLDLMRSLEVTDATVYPPVIRRRNGVGSIHGKVPFCTVLFLATGKPLSEWDKVTNFIN